MDRLNTEEFETMRVINDDRRRSKSLQEWAVILVMLTNFGGAIWFAARINTELQDAKIVNVQMTNILDKLVDKVAAQDISIAVIKSQLKIPQ